MNIAEKIIASLPKKLSGPKAQAALVLIISALSALLVKEGR